MSRPDRPALLALVPLAGLLLLACGRQAPPADPFAAFLAPLDGAWVGVLRESAALEDRIVREMPMRLVIDPEGESTVEYPMIACSGVLGPPPEGIDLPTESVARLQLDVNPPGRSPCMSGLVKLTRRGKALEYVFLGDSLRRIRAALLPQP